MGNLNRSGFLNAITSEWQEVLTTADITLSGKRNIRVFVDTTSNAVSVTIPAGTPGQMIEVIDAGENAGTNIITVVGTIDGVTNATIQADGASKTFAYNSAWESSGGFDSYFQRVAATSLITPKNPDTLGATIMLGGDPGMTYVGTPSNFSNAEANVDQEAGSWGNSYIRDASVADTTGATITASTSQGSYRWRCPASGGDYSTPCWSGECQRENFAKSIRAETDY